MSSAPAAPAAKGQAVATTTDAASAAAKSPAPLQPVFTFDSTAARVVSWAHPAVLVAGCYARLPALIDDPASTLESALPFVAAIQVAYAVVCFPVAGSQPQSGGRKGPRPGERRKNDAPGPNPIAASILSLILALIATPALHLLFVLFGAPFLDNVHSTLLCAAHLSALAAFPVFYTRGVDAQALTAIAGACAPLDEVFGGLLGAALGAWLGAVPIPLDWDREWQKWPVTIVVGMYLGYAVGAKALGTLLYGKRLATSAAEEPDE